MYVALVVPFFLSGLIFTLLFSTYARSIQPLYFWDLTGAAIGCALVTPLIEPIGPGRAAVRGGRARPGGLRTACPEPVVAG